MREKNEWVKIAAVSVLALSLVVVVLGPIILGALGMDIHLTR